eukprot:symbB.v1.2.033493.t1/scaffold4169.1/size43589/1
MREPKLVQHRRCPHILVEIILLKAAILDSMACSEDLEWLSVIFFLS